MELLTERIHVVERKHREGQRIRLLRYGLFCDRTTHGASLYYIKALSQLWEGSTLVRENLETSGGIGPNRPQAMAILARLCEARAPVLPEHVNEIVRDITGDPAARGRPSAPGIPEAASRLTRHRAGPSRPAGPAPRGLPAHRSQRPRQARREAPPHPHDLRRCRQGRVVYLDPRYLPGSRRRDDLAAGPPEDPDEGDSR